MFRKSTTLSAALLTLLLAGAVYARGYEVSEMLPPDPDMVPDTVPVVVEEEPPTKQSGDGQPGAVAVAEEPQSPSKTEALPAEESKVLNDQGQTEPARLGPRELIVNAAKRALATPYRYGSKKGSGLDCSGLTAQSYRDANLIIGNSAAAQFKDTRSKKIDLADAEPGDLLFFCNTYRRGVSHVGIYLGDGKILHASPRQKQTIESSLQEESYLRRHFCGAKSYFLPLEPQENNVAPNNFVTAK